MNGCSIRRESVDWINLAHETEKGRPVVNMVMDFRVSQTARIL